MKNRHGKLAEQLRKDFKISDSQYVVCIVTTLPPTQCVCVCVCVCVCGRFWWAKLRGLAHIGDYEELERFSKQRKSPIGYEVCWCFVERPQEFGIMHAAVFGCPLCSSFVCVLQPFAEVCLRHGNRREAAKYVSRAAPENKFRLYMSIECVSLPPPPSHPPHTLPSPPPPPHRDYHRAAETAFQDHRLDELEEVQLKAARDPELMETIRAFKSKLGFK